MTRPQALAVRVDGIPDAVKSEVRWICWSYAWREHEGKTGRWTKLPSGKTNDPATWSGYADALAMYQAGGVDGIGFCLGDGWAGIDLDHCVRDYDANTGFLGASTDEVGPFVQRLDRLGVYWEVSPSGTGYKAIGRSARIGGQIDFASDPPSFTTWSSARFFAITGHYQRFDSPLADIAGFIDDWFPGPIALPSTRTGYQDAINITDDELLMQMGGADNGDKFLALWRGDLSAYGGDHSRADQALVMLLAFWTNYDAERVDRLFRLSGLMRPKWDAVSYRRSTLAKALR